MFNYSDTWQLVINTGTTIVTFLIRASEASNKLIRAERLTESEVEELRYDQPPELEDQTGTRTADIAA